MTDDSTTSEEANGDSADGSDVDLEPTETGGGGDPGGMGTPGGGPRRVVSNESVDDILESVHSEPEADSTPTERETGTESEAELDVDDGTSAESDDTGEQIESEIAANEVSEPVEMTFDETELAETESSDADTETDETWIDSETITGADVRAAETGEGREETPEIDEIDLSIDDLEASSVPTIDESADVGSTDGPLAGQLEGGADIVESGQDDDDGRSDGIFGRIRRLLSR